MRHWRNETSRAVFPTLLLALLLALGAPGCSHAPPHGPAKRVILITCDTLRADHLGCYGYARPTSPNLDALARESVLFENGWSAAPLTGPSLSSLLSGRMPDEVGATPTNRDLMPASVTTLAEVVRDAGCATAAVVSNFVLCRPQAEQGVIGVQQGFQSFDDQMTSGETNRDDMLERNATACTDAALSWLASDAARSGPFFLWVHYQDPHGPYTPPEEHLAPFRRDHAGEPELEVSDDHGGRGKIPNYQVVGNERRPGEYLDRYDGEIHYFDAELGRLVAALRAKHLWGDALVVFTADHGEHMGEHGFRFCHGEDLWRELVHVPLIVKPPSAEKQRVLGARDSMRVKELAAHIDVWPTVLAALCVEGPKNRGVSLLDLPLPENRVVPQFWGPWRVPDHQLAITDGRWRVISPSQGTQLLFDLASDPDEMHDVAAEHPDVVKSLGERYVAFMSREKGATLQGVQRKMDAATLKGLRDLGYTDSEGGDR